MNPSATLLLRAVLILIGIGALAFLLWEPHIEGRNANATLFAIYFKDPFLAYAYVGSTPFFIGLYQAFKVLTYAARNEEFGAAAVRSVRTIKRSALALIAFVAIGVIIIMLVNTDDDRAGGVAIGILIIFASIVAASAMAVLERTLQRGADIKSENDLTQQSS